MSDRQRLLLSPYRLPTHHQVYLNEDEMAAWLNGYTVLWHPALLLGGEQAPEGRFGLRPRAADGRPGLCHARFAAAVLARRLAGPGAGRRGAEAPRATRTATRRSAAMIEAVREAGQTDEGRDHFGSPDQLALLDLPIEKVRPFVGLGFGYLIVDSLFEAMDHEQLLDVAGLLERRARTASLALLKPDARSEVDDTPAGRGGEAPVRPRGALLGQHPPARRLAPDRGQAGRAAAGGAGRRVAAQPDGDRPDPGATGRAVPGADRRAAGEARRGDPAAGAGNRRRRLPRTRRRPAAGRVAALEPAEGPGGGARRPRGERRGAGPQAVGEPPAASRPGCRRPGLRRAVLAAFDGARRAQPPGDGGELDRARTASRSTPSPACRPRPTRPRRSSTSSTRCTSRSPRTAPRRWPSCTRASRRTRCTRTGWP